MEGVEVDPVALHTAHDDVGGLAEQARPDDDERNARNGQHSDADESRGLGPEDGAESTHRDAEVLASFGGDAGGATGPERCRVERPGRSW